MQDQLAPVETLALSIHGDAVLVAEAANADWVQVCPLAERTPSRLRTEAMLLSGRTRASSRINCSVAASVFEDAGRNGS